MAMPRTVRNTRNGFSLVELMIVVAVLGVICAMALPQYRVSKKVSNEGAVISELRTLHSAAEMFRLQNGTYGTVADLAADDLVIDGFLGPRHGYSIANTGVTNATRWSVVATPLAVGTTGDRYFYIDQSGVIRASETPPPDDGSAPIGD